MLQTAPILVSALTMERPGDIIITVIITTGHLITDRRLIDHRIVRLTDRQAVLPGRRHCLQKDNIAVSNAR